VAEGGCWPMSEIRSSVIHRNLDAQLKVVGLEVYDLLFVLLFASVMNLIFGRTALSLYLVFILPMVMALVLFIVKRDKPEKFLIHWARYNLSPGFYSAGETSCSEAKRKTRIDQG
jgi:Ca2+/Na+ antiporter